ncbi:MAG: hypothetical protein IPP60_12350 [Sphingobacteriales bacterium]|nr:hypothetical protein [Sphingobacteriales bacterium]
MKKTRNYLTIKRVSRLIMLLLFFAGYLNNVAAFIPKKAARKLNKETKNMSNIRVLDSIFVVEMIDNVNKALIKYNIFVFPNWEFNIPYIETNPSMNQIEIFRGLFQSQYLDEEGIYLIISHEVSHILGDGTGRGKCNNNRFNEDMADYAAAKNMKIFFTDPIIYSEKMNMALTQVEHFLNRIDEIKYLKSKIKSCNGYSEKKCRLEMIRAGQNNLTIPVCGIHKNHLK